MSTTPPQDDKDGPEPTADLSELAATDALLDRLASRLPGDDDLLDPTVLLLNSLITEIDAEPGADSATARLVEVLAGRPLYIDGPSVPAAEDPLIDLTSGEPELAVGGDKPTAAAEDRPEVAAAAVPITAARRKRWQSAVTSVSAPVAAASIAVLVLLGGGVSAAVTGDPMAPINSVGKVVSKLPGVDSSGQAAKDAQKELELAQELMATDPDSAREHLAKAQKMLADLPDDKKAELLAQAEIVAAALPTGDPSDPDAALVTATASPGGPTTDPAATGGPATSTGTANPSTPASSSGGGGTTDPTTATTTTGGPTSTDPGTTTGATTTDSATTSTPAQATSDSSGAASSQSSPLDSATGE